MRQRAGWGALCGALAVGCGSVASGSELEPAPVLRLLHTSDIHSRLWPFRARISDFEAALGLGDTGTVAEVGGVARLATLLESEQRRQPSLWLDSGDAIEGAPIFQRYGGRIELELLGSLGLSAMALGNHELSLEAGQLADLVESSAAFPLLAVNLPPTAGSPLSGLLQPSARLEAGGVRVGVIGVANRQSPPGVGQTPTNAWELAPIADVAAAVQLAIDEIAPRTDLVVVLSHLGLDGDRALIRASTGIAVLLGGHQHLLTAEPVWQDDCSTNELQLERGCSPRRVPILHSGAYGQWLTRLDLQLGRDPLDSERLEVTGVVSRALPINASVLERSDVVAYLAQLEPPPAPPLAFSPSALPRRAPLGGDSALGDLTADAMRIESGADAVVFNGSGLREDLEAGVILRSDLELAFPFAEPWRLARLSGRELRRGLLRAARRSAGRGCESSLQVAGLHLQVRCALCGASSERCLEVERDSAFGRAQLLDDEHLLVAMPEYLTLPGADFEAAAQAGEAFDVAVPEALARLLARRSASSDPRRCADALGAWSLRRCLEAFGELSCPLDTARATSLCAELPLLEETPDARIEMRP